MARDPLSPGKRAQNLGGAALHRGGNPRWEQAEVLAYNSNTHTAVVRTHNGRPLFNVPRIQRDGGDFSNLKQGTTVIVTWDLGFPAILGTLSMPGPPQEAIAAPTLTAVDGVGDDNPIQPVDGSNTYKSPYAPTDMTQGDWAQVGTLGNHVAVLEGGVSQVGSPTALFRSIGTLGIAQIIAQQMQTVTDFGQWTVENDQGRTSFILRAGTNQKTESGLDEQHWTIRFDLGAKGDVFNLQITDPVGKTLFKFHIGSNGKFQIYGDGGGDISTGPNGDKESLHDIAGDRTNRVGGDDVLQVDGTRTVQVGKSVTENINTDRLASVGNTDALNVNKDRVVTVGGNKTEVVAGGDALSAMPGQVAYEVKVLNGGYVMDIGNPADGANISALAGYKLRTSLGDIGFDAGGRITMKANIGVAVGEATDSWMLGTTYRAAEGAMNQQLMENLISIGSIMSAQGPILTSSANAAGAVFTSLAPLFTAMATFINNFETNAANYLSKKNTTD